VIASKKVGDINVPVFFIGGANDTKGHHSTGDGH
jgi:hypothetical protein